MLNVRCIEAERDSEDMEKFLPPPKGGRQEGADLLLAEGHTVSALVLGGVGLVGAHHDPVQGAVVGVLGVVGALLDGTLDALVGVHNELPP